MILVLVLACRHAHTWRQEMPIPAECERLAVGPVELSRCPRDGCGSAAHTCHLLVHGDPAVVEVKLPRPPVVPFEACACGRTFAVDEWTRLPLVARDSEGGVSADVRTCPSCSAGVLRVSCCAD